MTVAANSSCVEPNSSFFPIGRCGTTNAVKKKGGVKLLCTIFHYPDMTEILKIVNGDGEVQTIIESLEVSEDLWKR